MIERERKWKLSYDILDVLTKDIITMDDQLSASVLSSYETITLMVLNLALKA